MWKRPSSLRRFSIIAGSWAPIPSAQWQHVQVGRALASSGDANKAKAAYQDFLALWKDADPDIPILKQAQTEYARLR